MIKRITYSLMALAAAAGCAKVSSESSNDLEKQYLDAWISVNHPSATVIGKGIYLLEETPPTGGKSYDGQNFAYVSYDASSIDGTISYTTEEKLAQQTGSYTEGYYYGPRTWFVSDTSVPAGIEDMLTGMTVGQTRKALIPSWLMAYKRYKKDSEYIKHTVEKASPSIYSITLKDCFDDVIKWQIDSIERFNSHNYGQIDSTAWGYYFKTLKEPLHKGDFPEDTTVYVHYTGRRLDGSVFDTTVKKVAIESGIYDSSNSYEPIAMSWGTSYDRITFADLTTSSDPITGFKRAVWDTGAMGRGVAVFTSNYGYQQTGSGGVIPPYAPLLFEIELVKEP